MKTRITLLILALILACSTPLLAQDKQGGASSVKALRAALQLSEEQVESLRGLLEVRHEASKAGQEQIKEMQALLDAELGSDTPDSQAIGDLMLDIRGVREEIGQHNQAFQESFRALLTEDQQGRMRQIHRTALFMRAAEALRDLKIR